MIDFAWSWAWFFLPLPLLTYFFFPKFKREEQALRVPSLKSFKFQSKSKVTKARPNIFRLILLFIAWASLVIAAARPQLTGEPINLPVTGRDIMLAVDVSGSMGTEDMELNGVRSTRLSIVKKVVSQFVDQRVGDRLGLILFGTRAYSQTPLTFDRKTVKALLKESPLGIAGGKTAIGDAIGLGVKRLKDRPAENRVLIMLTDGVNNVGEVDPIQASKLAAKEGIRIYTIGFGSESMTIPGLLFERTVNPSAELDSQTLIKIAENTGGIYHRAKSAAELSSIYADLNKLEPINQDPEIFRPTKELFHVPLALSLLITLIIAVAHLRISSIANKAFTYVKSRVNVSFSGSN